MANMFQIKVDVITPVLLLYLLAEQASDLRIAYLLIPLLLIRESLNMKPPNYYKEWSTSTMSVRQW